MVSLLQVNKRCKSKLLTVLPVMATLVEILFNDGFPELLVVDPALVAIDHHVPRITTLVERSQTLKYKPSSIGKLLPELEKKPSSKTNGLLSALVEGVCELDAELRAHDFAHALWDHRVALQVGHPAVVGIAQTLRTLNKILF